MPLAISTSSSASVPLAQVTAWLGAAERRQFGLECPHFRAEDELAMAEHARDRGIDGAAEPAALRGHVDERNHGRVGSLIH